MYVYIKSEPDHLWTVGFYSPTGEWQPESDWDNIDDASNRVNYLNGGIDPILFKRLIDAIGGR